MPNATKIEGTVGEWYHAPNGEYVGTIIGDDGGVYIANSKNCHDQSTVGQITKGSRVRITPDPRGSGKDVDTKDEYSWGVARNITPIP